MSDIKANANSWNAKSTLFKPQKIVFEQTLTVDEFSTLEKGYIPKSDSDKWFVYFDDMIMDEVVGMLKFFRAHNGRMVYLVPIEKSGGDYKIPFLFAERYIRYWKNTNESDAQIICYLINCFLLGKKDAAYDDCFKALEILEEQSKEWCEVADSVNTHGKGKWVKFNSKTSDPQNFQDNVEKLKALVSGTPWCTKQLADLHLTEGDFYIFIDNGSNPQVAVKFDNNKVGQVRGILPYQQIETEYLRIADSFLVSNYEKAGARDWEASVKLNESYISYNKMILNGTFKPSNIPSLMGVLAKSTKDYGKNAHKAELLKNIQTLKQKFLQRFKKVPEDYIEYFSKTQTGWYEGSYESPSNWWSYEPFILFHKLLQGQIGAGSLIKKK